MKHKIEKNTVQETLIIPGILKLTHKTSHKQYTSPFFFNL